MSAATAEQPHELIRTVNETAPVITTPIEQLSGAQILSVMENVKTGAKSLEEEMMEEHKHHHHHDHEHDHDHDGECCCGHHHEHGHHHHHADEVFQSYGKETVRKFSEEDVKAIVEALADSDTYGVVLRAKGILASNDGGDFIHFDMVPEELEIRRGPADYTGRFCVIGAGLKEDAIEHLFFQ